jgi:DNA-binding LacI/PurR family transcriptional regulator
MDDRTVSPPGDALARDRATASGARQPLRRAATIYDVAKLANVSHQTVSRLLKGYQGIRPETRQRVEAALVDLKYRPNLVARSLATNRSHRIGALAHEIEQVGPGRILVGASRAAREAGYLLDIISFDPTNESDIQRALRMTESGDLAGIIAFASTDAVTEAFSATRFTVPCYVEGEDEDSVETDVETRNATGVRLLVEHLAKLGHTRFLEIAGPQEWISARNRHFAYQSALESHGLAGVATSLGDWSPASGYAAAMALPLDSGATALVVANDQMALGAIRALSERGLSVPEEMSVVGFDDIPEAPFFQPPLTTIRLDFDLQGRLAFAKLLERLGETVPGPPPPPFVGELIIRSSTAQPRTGRR